MALPAYLTGPDTVKQNPATGRWFITIGHAGFNSKTNNANGYATDAAALAAFRRFSAAYAAYRHRPLPGVA